MIPNVNELPTTSHPVRFSPNVSGVPTEFWQGGFLCLEEWMEIQNFIDPTGNVIRILIGADGEPRWVANDICSALGYSDSSLNQLSNIVCKIPEEWRGLNPIKVGNRMQDVHVLTEQGVYFLLFRSDKLPAIPFQKWLAGNVLPQIRRNGAYTHVPQTLSQALRLAADQAETIEKQTLLIESQRPAVEFVERFVEAKQTQPLRAVAKVLGIKEKVFVSALLEKGILYRLSGKLTPKAEMMDKGFFEVKELVAANGYATTQMRFTTDGIEWIARKVQEWGIDA